MESSTELVNDSAVKNVSVDINENGKGSDIINEKECNDTTAHQHSEKENENITVNALATLDTRHNGSIDGDSKGGDEEMETNIDEEESLRASVSAEKPPEADSAEKPLEAESSNVGNDGGEDEEMEIGIDDKEENSQASASAENPPDAESINVDTNMSSDHGPESEAGGEDPLIDSLSQDASRDKTDANEDAAATSENAKDGSDVFAAPSSTSATAGEESIEDDQGESNLSAMDPTELENADDASKNSSEKEVVDDNDQSNERHDNVDKSEESTNDLNIDSEVAKDSSQIMETEESDDVLADKAKETDTKTDDADAPIEESSAESTKEETEKNAEKNSVSDKGKSAAEKSSDSIVIVEDKVDSTVKGKRKAGQSSDSIVLVPEDEDDDPDDPDEVVVDPVPEKKSEKPYTPKPKSRRTASECSFDGKESGSSSRRQSVTQDEKKMPESSPSESRRPTRQAAKRAEDQIRQLAAELESEEREENGENGITSEDLEDAGGVMRRCHQCGTIRVCKYQLLMHGMTRYLCNDTCFSTFRKNTNIKSITVRGNANGETQMLHVQSTQDIPERKCSQCMKSIIMQSRSLSWETMEFCNEECLGRYQTKLGSHCASCNGAVQSTSLGKYCVRFGCDIKQFCSSSCLEDFKKGLKVCSYCQKDISSGTEGFLAPVGDKGQFKDFCSQECMEKYDQMSNNKPEPTTMTQCAVCSENKLVNVEVILDGKINKLCSEPCFSAFKFVNQVKADQCDMCKKYFDKRSVDKYSVYYDYIMHNFCCKTCMNVYILANRKIVPCNWCKVKKYNFDMIKRVMDSGQVLLMCSLNCLSLYQVSISASSSRRVRCDFCGLTQQPQYHLTMSDASIRNFCAYSCVMAFQNQYAKSPTLVQPTGPAVPVQRPTPPVNSDPVPVISSVTSLAQNSTGPVNKQQGTVTQTKSVINNQVIVKPTQPKQQRNKFIMCKPFMQTKGVSCKPHPCHKSVQTDEALGSPVLVPVPIPIFVPAPMHMYSSPFPVPLPFPLPVPVPIFIPTTRNSVKGIMQEIKAIQEKIPTDPFEAELLMMAEMVAEDKKEAATDSESDGGGGGDDVGTAAADEDETVEAGVFSPEVGGDSSATFGDDMLQMALKMATEMDEPPVDLEAALTPSTVTAQSISSSEQPEASVTEDEDDPSPVKPKRPGRGRKRGARGSGRGRGAKKQRVASPVPHASSDTADVDRPDSNMCLKYTFGVNAWKQWVLQKNSELEKAASGGRRLKLFKTDLLQLTPDELNYSLCLFIKEVRKPNSAEYPPDVVFYLCLGIQQYLFENERQDNIFADSYYEKFTECLDEVTKKFQVQFDNPKTVVVTRIEEEQLWESKQLGAHSPFVLLNTLMYFNTKLFMLKTVDEHLRLSFSHVMKHWKKSGVPTGRAPAGSRSVLLRYYPPQVSDSGDKKKVYEQHENEENPLRCPVKLYEFYLSKCPESTKNRTDMFYLSPERSCVPDSPVWFSTMALGKEPLSKMLNRIQMVKEVNEKILANAS